MITYKKVLDELKREIGPVAKIFLDNAIEALGIEEVNDSNYKEVLEVLRMNKELREYIDVVEEKLEKES
jgi:hypothetical protein